jgi:lysophospholipase L1-like esterase
MSFEDISNKPEMFADGIHLNDKGHKLISERVKPELERLLGN